MEADDGLLLPLRQPEISGNPTVVLVDSAIALPPRVELAGRDAKPPDETPGTELGLIRCIFRGMPITIPG